MYRDMGAGDVAGYRGDAGSLGETWVMVRVPWDVERNTLELGELVAMSPECLLPVERERVGPEMSWRVQVTLGGGSRAWPVRWWACPEDLPGPWPSEPE